MSLGLRTKIVLYEGAELKIKGYNAKSKRVRKEWFHPGWSKGMWCGVVGDKTVRKHFLTSEWGSKPRKYENWQKPN